MKFHFLCTHVFLMAMKPDTKIRIEPMGIPNNKQKPSAGVCESCDKALSPAYKQDYKITVIRRDRVHSKKSQLKKTVVT